ncbi:MAG: DeoR/GlpR transcriptional regulator [Clostridiales bacterium]|nr:DeoR/GlpR transcriptional regulator [Clostridiales bacterium]MBQ3046789.1 DeoR/GlpR transcriptional regulator [Clostridia bacterium]
MLSLERQEEILEILNKNKSVTVEELAAELFVSGATIRRDLRAMEKQGLIKRSHGGAMPFKSSAEESAFAIREQENTAAKRTIANLAVKLIKNGDSVFLDSSSTTGLTIPMLNNFKYLSVTTTGLRNALLLSQTNNIKIYIAGGQIQNHSNSIIGTDTMDYISRIHADVCLVSCSGLDINSGFTESSIEQAKLKQQMRKNSTKMAVLCDSTKLGKTFLCTDFHFEDIDYFITEKTPPIEYVEKIAQTKCKLITPENTNF